MLFLKSQTSWQALIDKHPAFVLLPAGDERESANDMAVTAKIEGHGVRILHGTRAFYVCAINGASSQIVGFARSILTTHGLDWFILRLGGDLAQEFGDRSRKPVVMTDAGFVLESGEVFVCETIYYRASNVAAWGESQGFDVGEHL